MKPEVVAIILCAGESSRMGTPKALLKWGEASVLQHIVVELEKTGIDRMIVVTGAHDAQIRTQLSSISGICFKNEQWASGMGSSIAAGVKEAGRRFENIEGFLVLLGDQPLIGQSYLRSMLDAFSESPGELIASEYPEGAGVPALFPSSFARQLENLQGREGARSLLRNTQTNIRLCLPGEAGRDMDTPEEYTKLRRLWSVKKKDQPD